MDGGAWWAAVHGVAKSHEGATNTYLLALLTTPKPLTVWITKNWKILKEIGIPAQIIFPKYVDKLLVRIP